MTPAHDRAVREAADAELRGDAAEALRLHRSVPMFRRSTHGDQLQQLAELGADAPGWLINRWLTVQARRRVWTGSDERATNRALQLVVPMVYPDGIPIERIGCTWPEQVLPYIVERDWVVRQVDVYELSGLSRVVERFASAQLIERTDQITAWCRAPMRALRVDSSTAVTDLHSREVIEVFDLGLSEHVEPGQHLLGRISPTAVEPGAMFEWQPLPVPEEAAYAVARDPHLWLTTLGRLATAGRLPSAYSHLPEASLTSDLPRHAWMSLAGVNAEDDPDPNDVVADAVREALALADHGSDAVKDRRHLIGELLLDVSFSQRVRWKFVSPDLLPAWKLLADVLPDHARLRAEEMAMWCAAAPDLPDAIA